MARRPTLPLVALALALSSFHSERPAPVLGPAPAPIEMAAEPAPAPAVAAVMERLAEHHTGLADFEIRPVAEAIVREAAAHDMEPELVLAVIRVESGYYNFAVSQVGAMGLMQLLPSTAEELALDRGLDWYGPQTLFDPASNVALGVAYLSWLRERYHDTGVALAAYNWGPGQIDRRLRQGTAVPAGYAKRVLDSYRKASRAAS